MRVLAIDYGDARTGIAISDSTGSICGNAYTMHEKNLKNVVELIAGVAQEVSAEVLVLGYPKNMDGSVGPRAEKAELLKGLLESATSLPVVLWDERRTTVDAHRILTEAGRRGKARKDKVDAVAATLILEGYLGTLTKPNR